VLPIFYDFQHKLKTPGGFRLRNAASEREWDTTTGKANFISAPLPKLEVAKGRLKLMTIRSHDQYNTTIYGNNDRYRGIYGERKIVLVNEEDMKELDLQKDETVNIHSFDSQDHKRTAFGFKVKPYNIPKGCAAAYFPETNVLVPIDSIADKSHTPTSKYIVVELQKQG
jgi:anaerobic selenocysteine-containing dehydrogenase